VENIPFFNVMQKVSSAISIALLSNIVLSHSRIEEAAQRELSHLMEIREKFANDSVTRIINSEIRELNIPLISGLPFWVTLKAPSDPPLDSRVDLDIPNIWYNVDEPDGKYTVLGDVQTLEKMRQFWNMLASTTECWEVGEVDSISLRLHPPQNPYDPEHSKDIPWKSPGSSTSDMKSIKLPKIGKPTLSSTLDQGRIIEFRYNISPALTFPGDPHTPVQS
jgi:hypothetical protein